jgi:hypothetical protein
MAIELMDERAVMPRKRNNLKDLRGIDPKSQSYWNEVLVREGLGMGVGTSSKLSYAGSGSRLEYIEGVEDHSFGRVAPKKPSE